ncbi:MAG TPA: phosphopantetheine-binding protein, partial [Candidatus Paceibacterota bacterium]|nr:phosphopantetheine-binding protein [Candidatus Paceibacterota bacterium]
IGPVESALAQIWSEVLGVERVGRHDNFFDLGGHSLLAIRVLERMRRVGIGSDVQALFTTPVLSALAATVNDRPDLSNTTNDEWKSLPLRHWTSL